MKLYAHDALFAELIVVLFLVASSVEAWVLIRRGGRYPLRAVLASLVVALSQRVVQTLQVPFILTGAAWLWQHRIATVALPQPLQIAAVFAATEFAYYWIHRASHRVSWLWATHSVHHSARTLTLPVAIRLGIMGFVLGEAFFFVPLLWVGFSPRAVFASLSLNLVYQFFLHTELIPALGPLEYVLNTPSHHRVHHAVNDAYVDKNFGGVLIVYDRLFGTFAAESPAAKPVYGLIGEDRGDSPVRILFGGWLILWRDLARASSWPARFRVALGRPGSLSGRAATPSA
jgi:sterol desaturase/sphingolipid hydroxylase (fatty acid hydroxylase superfamily)